jgi:hypothetical protein
MSNICSEIQRAEILKIVAEAFAKYKSGELRSSDS